ncbi:hypothetical protein C8Q77DRAFT_1098567 [Trametes polyzona]|nr:hypothetical protein C8Q77DRAFT_1098567 [Trametes polyzona]
MHISASTRASPSRLPEFLHVATGQDAGPPDGSVLDLREPEAYLCRPSNARAATDPITYYATVTGAGAPALSSAPVVAGRWEDLSFGGMCPCPTGAEERARRPRRWPASQPKPKMNVRKAGVRTCSGPGHPVARRHTGRPPPPCLEHAPGCEGRSLWGKAGSDSVRTFEEARTDRAPGAHVLRVDGGTPVGRAAPQPAASFAKHPGTERATRWVEGSYSQAQTYDVQC